MPKFFSPPSVLNSSYTQTALLPLAFDRISMPSSFACSLETCPMDQEAKQGLDAPTSTKVTSDILSTLFLCLLGEVDANPLLVIVDKVPRALA